MTTQPLFDLIEDRTWDKEGPKVITHFTGTEDECYIWIHKHTSFSWDMALKHQGYSLRPHQS